MAEKNEENRPTFTTLLVNTLSHLNSESATDLSLQEFLPGVRELFGSTGILWYELDQLQQFLSLASYSGPFEPDAADLETPAADGFFKTVLESSTPQVLEGPALKGNLPESLISGQDVEIRGKHHSVGREIHALLADQLEITLANDLALDLDRPPQHDALVDEKERAHENLRSTKGIGARSME